MNISKYKEHDKQFKNELTSSKPLKESWLHSVYEKRKQQNRDLKIFVTDSDAGTGTGKTTLSLILGYRFDTHKFTDNNTTMKVNEATDKYVELPEKSGLVFDELGNQADKYRQGSKVNRALNNIVNLGRVYQKYIIFNHSSISEVDRELRKKGDVWISIIHRGKARVHKINWSEYKEKLTTPIMEIMTWKPIQLEKNEDIYKHLAKRKKSIVMEKGSDELISKKELNKRLKQAKKEAKRKKRDKIIKNLYNQADLSQRDIAEIVDLSNSTVNNILNK